MKIKLNELNQKWDSLKAKASQRRQDLEDSLQAQQYFADANEAESWMREKEPIVGSTDYGKDEDSAEVFEICCFNQVDVNIVRIWICPGENFRSSADSKILGGRRLLRCAEFWFRARRWQFWFMALEMLLFSGLTQL